MSLFVSCGQQRSTDAGERRMELAFGVYLGGRTHRGSGDGLWSRTVWVQVPAPPLSAVFSWVIEKEPSLHFIFKIRTIPWLRKLFVELNNKLTEILAHSKHVTKIGCWHYMGIYTLYRSFSLTCIHFEMKMRKGEERDCKFLRYVITQ